MPLSTFRSAFRRLVPWWLSEGEGGLVLYTIGVLLDGFRDKSELGTLYRFPEYAPEDALAVIGQARRMRRGIGEAREAYARRLLAWRQFHKVNGNPFALLRQIRTYLNLPIRVRTVDARGNWYTIDADGTQSYQWGLENWDWDGSPPTPEWAKFWVIIYSTGANAPWVTKTIGDGRVLGEPNATMGCTATRQDVAAIRAIVEESKPLHAHIHTVVVAFDDSLFDPSSPEPDGLWGNYSTNIAGAQTATRHPSARYWYFGPRQGL